MSGGWDRRAPAVWRTEQGRALREWLRREVVPFSAFWSGRLRNVEIRSAADLESVPSVVEADVAGAGGPGNPGLLILPTEEGFKRHAAAADVLAAAREVRGGGREAREAVLFRRYKPVHVHEAGVGQLLAVAYTRSDLDRLHLAGARLVEVLGLGADDRMVNLVPAAPALRFWGLYHAALAARMTALHPRGAGQLPVAPALRALALLPATVLAVPAAEAQPLLDGLSGAGARLATVRTLLTVGPPPEASARIALAETLARLGASGARVQAVWAPPTARALWAECRPASTDPEAIPGLHTDPGMEVVQVRDVVTGRPADDGEIVHTSVGWRGTALVRFRSGAWTAGLARDPCPACGRTVPRLAAPIVEAAWQPRVLVTDGQRLLVDLRGAPASLTPAALAGTGVRDWSFGVDDGHFTLAVDGGDPPALERLAARVGAAVGVVPAVEVDPRAAARRPRLGPHPPAAPAADLSVWTTR